MWDKRRTWVCYYFLCQQVLFILLDVTTLALSEGHATTMASFFFGFYCDSCTAILADRHSATIQDAKAARMKGKVYIGAHERRATAVCDTIAGLFVAI